MNVVPGGTRTGADGVPCRLRRRAELLRSTGRNAVVNPTCGTVVD